MFAVGVVCITPEQEKIIMSSSFIYSTEFKMYGSLAGSSIISNQKVYYSDYYSVSSSSPKELSTLIQLVTLKRANMIEAEIKPLYQSINQRNTYLKELGEGLSLASAVQADAQAQNDGKGGEIKNDDRIVEAAKILRKYYDWDDTNDGVLGYHGDSAKKWTLGECAQAVQMYKSEIDVMNNANSQDMNRMQSIVDMRDQAYSLASDMTSSFGDARSSVIRNIGG